ncbi:MAG TPA: DUF72 domain-containing protein [Rhizomicrobium sp.]|nr:DUF72 domain-containing protein [Rhizomicrobium sp.]
MIRAGVGGWNFEPWRGTFFPKGLSKAKELHYASRALTTIEVNGTFYSTFKPPTFQKWASETPDDFVFALKANRFAVNRRVLGEAGPSIQRFLESGVTELKHKLGPILWQFMHTKKFDPVDFEAFLALLPAEMNGMKLRHAVEPRHESFKTAEFIALARKYDVAIVYADVKKFPSIPDATSDFVYARLQDTQEDVPTGYTPAALKKWVEAAKAWADGGLPKGMEPVGKAAAKKKRDVFMFFISGAKVRNPAAAVEFLKLAGK